MKTMRGTNLNGKHRPQLFSTAFPAAELSLALILLVTAAPYAKGSGIYSGASVGSDGTVYGWGVTNVPGGQTMTHTNYVSGTLSSPGGRQASGYSSGIDFARYDVSLSYDTRDTGTYIVQSLSSVYCTGCMCWIVWNAYTQAQATNYSAYPINFTQNGSSNTAGGELYFLYSWQSSSGNTADLAACSVGEYVTYPGYVEGQQNTYWWPSPPWQPTHSSNPNQDWVSGNQGPCQEGGLYGAAPCVIDNQQHSSFDAPPTVDGAFTAQQKWWYQCPGVNGGNPVDITTFTTIQRSVTHNGSTYTYHVTKSSASASCVSGQTCSGP
jgi:hypothetical protein